MPPPALPPTPISSTDISAKDGLNISSLELSFKLPPPAIPREDGSRSSSASNSSSSSFRTMSPTSPLTTSEHITSRRRPPTTTATAGESFALPPPPTRPRKIIQMKPPPEEPPDQQQTNAPAKGTQNNKTASQTIGSKRKQPAATSVAGRKIARKTAHSLIERRRRSKMNEEFGLLKQMIPACQDQDMHKLAILQASIDYLRYLEQCIVDLKANNNTHSSHHTTPPFVQTHRTPQADDPDQGPNIDIYMFDPSSSSPDDGASPSQEEPPSHCQQQQPPPSYSATPTPLPEQQQQQQRHYSFPILPHSAATSPTIHPHSTPTSPTLLLPQDPDQEAAGALLLLDTDRRGSSVRGMSVKDLLGP
ncbi:MAG: hypothetical protein M1840_005805 [Geoglossum simile]|nr:MAG: hypothetical protein M1840_005805 [Geoglossum simile]